MKRRITAHQMHAKKKNLGRSRVSAHEKTIKAQQGKCARKNFAAREDKSIRKKLQQGKSCCALIFLHTRSTLLCPYFSAHSPCCVLIYLCTYPVSKDKEK